MKNIVFIYSSKECDSRGRCIDLLSKEISRASNVENGVEVIDLVPVFNQFGKKWFELFSSWLGGLNCRNASVSWWAYTSTAKNCLSSPLAERFLQVEAICEIARQERTSTLYVIGATPGQMDSVASLLPSKEFLFSGRAWHGRHWSRRISGISAFARHLIHSCLVWQGFFGYRLPPDITKSPDLCLFTYIDGIHRAGVDNYFGKLPQILNRGIDDLSVFYLAYVCMPYRERLRQLFRQSKEKDALPYVALFGMLRLTDHFSVLLNTMKAWWRNETIIYHGLDEYASLIREAFMHDIAAGQYLHNLLMYRAICRFSKFYTPKVFVYPFENKSLEKMILLGFNEAQYKPTIVGYQHTSITPRHSTFLLTASEAEHTPLPDKIITVGEITRQYLETVGNFPHNIFVTGCALRQKWGNRLHRQNVGNIRVLLALSSSKNELVRSIEFFKQVLERMPTLELGIRPHINFPLSLLPANLGIWVNRYARDLSGTLLEDNLNWCSLTAYVSSTVGLETLMRGKPIVNISIGETISADPVMGEAPFHWSACNDLEMVNVILQVQEMSNNEYENGSVSAIAYANNYLAPIDNACMERFRVTLDLVA